MEIKDKSLNFAGVYKNAKVKMTKTTRDYTALLQQYMLGNSSRYGITRMGIFGSVARGEQHENSDIDVCVEGNLKGMFALAGVKSDLEALFNRPVDVVRLRERMDPFFRKQILKDVIYV